MSSVPVLNCISTAEFAAYFQPPMRDVTATADPVVDIWPYVDAVSADDVAGLAIRDVEYVYRDPAEQYEHVLIGLGETNRYLVIVIDRDGLAIVGHHFLDLVTLYDLDASTDS